MTTRRTSATLKVALALAAFTASGTALAQTYYKWQTVEMPSASGARCGNGSPYRIFVNRTPLTSKTVVMFEGGGACWAKGSCSGEGGLLGASNPDGVPANYVTSLSMAAYGLITPFTSRINPFASIQTQSWNIIYVPYCTGDVHTGNRSAVYPDADPTQPALTYQHRGAANAAALAAWMGKNMPRPDHLLVTGFSAGGAGATANYAVLREAVQPKLSSMLADSGPLVQAPRGSGAASLPLHEKIRVAWGLDGPDGLVTKMLAKYPAENRDEARLMVVNRAKGTIEHRIFKDIIDYFDEGDLFVFNDTKVFPARLYGNKEKTGAEIEIFLLRELNRELRLWDVLVDPARKIRIGNKLYFGDDDLMVAEVIDNTTSRGRTLRFLFDGDYDEFKTALFKLGETPLPRWVREKVEPEDSERYQTIFAAKEGAVVAPTAGMHFSKHLMKRMEIRGVERAFLTLHAGLGNFRTVDVEDLSKHKMDSEQYIVDDATAASVNRAKRNGRKVVSIGTTVMRTLETVVSTNGTINAGEGWTNKFIFSPYEFTVADAMVSNFHLPYSTQLMMVAAFGGYDCVMNAYKIAREEGYRFGTYGDAMLLL